MARDDVDLGDRAFVHQSLCRFRRRRVPGGFFFNHDITPIYINLRRPPTPWWHHPNVSLNSQSWYFVTLAKDSYDPSMNGLQKEQGSIPCRRPKRRNELLPRWCFGPIQLHNKPNKHVSRWPWLWPELLFLRGRGTLWRRRCLLKGCSTSLSC